MSFITCAAVVGLGLPDVFALGAASGKPHFLIISCAIGWDGILIATVSSPAQTSFGIISLFGSIIVSGPGQ